MHYSWFEYDFAKQVSKNFRKIFNGKKIKKVILNYESIPSKYATQNNKRY